MDAMRLKVPDLLRSRDFAIGTVFGASPLLGGAAHHYWDTISGFGEAAAKAMVNEISNTPLSVTIAALGFGFALFTYLRSRGSKNGTEPPPTGPGSGPGRGRRKRRYSRLKAKDTPIAYINGKPIHVPIDKGRIRDWIGVPLGQAWKELVMYRLRSVMPSVEGFVKNCRSCIENRKTTLSCSARAFARSISFNEEYKTNSEPVFL